MKMIVPLRAQVCAKPRGEGFYGLPGEDAPTFGGVAFGSRCQENEGNRGKTAGP